MDTIEMELAGETIATTFRPKGAQPLTHHLSLPSVVELSCLLMRGGNLRMTTAVQNSAMWLQVEQGRQPHASWGLSQEGHPDLVACIEGGAVREVGRRLHDHWLRAKGLSFDGPERSIVVRPISHFYLDDLAARTSKRAAQ